MSIIPYLPSLNFFIGLINALPYSVREFVYWALGLAGFWALIHVLLDQT